MTGIVGLLALLGGGYYVSRLVPRVVQRMNSSQGRGAAAAGQAAAAAAAAYRRFEHPFFHQMSREEALLILGFEPGDAIPAQAAIKEKHRALVSQFHADVSGSPAIAQKINEARDYLLKS